jgi:hypothetical protein
MCAVFVRLAMNWVGAGAVVMLASCYNGYNSLGSAVSPALQAEWQYTVRLLLWPTSAVRIILLSEQVRLCTSDLKLRTAVMFAYSFPYAACMRRFSVDLIW